MFVVRTKIIAVLICCAVSTLLISSYYKKEKLRIKTCENCQNKFKEHSNTFKEISESLDENLQYDYSYETFEKENMFFDRDRSITTEIEVEPQNYNVINKIEYVDFMNNSEEMDVKRANSNIISLSQLLSVCIKAVKAGGIQLKTVRRNFDLKEIRRMKPANSSDNPVSVGRMLSHQAMAYILKKYFPSIQLVSRNGYSTDTYKKEFQPQKTSDDDLVSTKDILVWFDPLDPEYEYQQNLLEYVTTTVCVTVKGKPVIGVIHQPFENFTKWGWVGHGESTDTYPVASEPVDVSKPISIILPAFRAEQVKIKARLDFGVHFDMFPVNGAGFSFIQVTEGRADGYLHVFDVRKWKICAGDAIIKAADGKMTTLGGKEIDYGDPARFTHERGFKATIKDLDLFEDLSSFEGKEHNS